MKRRVILILLLLVAGAIVNVAVAWGLVSPLFWKPWFAGMTNAEVDSGFFHLDGWEWHFSTAQRMGLRTTEVRPLRPFFLMKPEETRPPVRIVIPLWRANNKINALGRIEAGWPRRSLQYAYGYRGDWTTVQGFAVRGGWRLEDHPDPGTKPTSGQFAALPWMIVWPGFAINTVFYAGVVWMLFAAPFALRRLRGGRRIKRGLCPKCAYPRGAGTNSVCTECGAVVGAGSTPSTRTIRAAA